MPDLISIHGWPMLLALAASAVVIGFSKTSFGGIAAISVAVFALAMPAKESTATVLLLLIVGDMIAITRYRKVSWRLLWKLVPGVVPGLLLGALFMNVVDDVVMRRTSARSCWRWWRSNSGSACAVAPKNPRTPTPTGSAPG